MNFSNIAELRAHRDTLLAESDAWFLPDFPFRQPLTFEELEDQIKAYRIQLRDWPKSESDLSNATVPRKPVI